MVGLNTSDDAGVFRLNNDLALVQTVDFFTPVVDDPYTFGQVAAANALSDVYAMGAKPVTALNIVCFPVGKLDMTVLAEILRGGHAKIEEAGAVLVGGHSIHDNEPKYGLSLTGVVHPEQIWTNAGAKPGDHLILTKPLGVGIITTAIKRGVVPPQVVEQVVKVMTMLNKAASEAALKVGIESCTDITGFGLLGHAHEMAQASEVALEIYADRVPVIDAVWEYVAENIVPGGTIANLKHLAEVVAFDQAIPRENQLVLADAITSGGLLFAVSPEKSADLLDELLNRGVESATIIGKVVPGTAGTIKVKNYGGSEFAK